MIKSRSFILDQITPIKIFAKLQKMFGREISLLFESGEKGEFSFMLIGAKEELKYYNGKNGNPNGSMERIAGILNKERNVLGMMPHPERAVESILGSDDGIDIFKSMIGVA